MSDLGNVGAYEWCEAYRRAVAENDRLRAALAEARKLCDIRDGLEIRKNDDGSIDEVIAKGCAIHLEQMHKNAWYLGIDAKDGSHWQFWLGAKSDNCHVVVRHTEMTPAEEAAQRVYNELSATVIKRLFDEGVSLRAELAASMVVRAALAEARGLIDELNCQVDSWSGTDDLKAKAYAFLERTAAAGEKP